MPWPTFTRKSKLVEKSTDKLKTAVVQTAESIHRPPESPDVAMKELFDAVQDQLVYPDSKTFADLVPRGKAKTLLSQYLLAKDADGFDIRQFVNEHFYEFKPRLGDIKSIMPTDDPRQHVRDLWPELTRRNRKNRGSLIALPYPYVVPGGRFDEQFYWDSYFIMLGLARDKHWDLVLGMMRNFTYMLRKFGYIPTANRTYFLSRSQPPFFALMVELLASHRGKTRTYAEFLPSLLTEYRFWMKGRRTISEEPSYTAYARVVYMDNGGVLNRYYDNKQSPRPESRREDVATALLHPHDSNRVYLNLRAGAESGWDFSSRWLGKSGELDGIETTNILPVDLNSLLYKLEMTIAEVYTLIRQPLLARRFRHAAERRAEMIDRYFWAPKKQFYFDYDNLSRRQTSVRSLAALYPLFVGVASDVQAAAVASDVQRSFLKTGGLVATTKTSAEQWDSPNGWAPLQYVAIEGLRRYGYDNLADEIRDRWIKTVEVVYAEKHKFVEKYNVELKLGGGGGEYQLQDGFGWTNGVYAHYKDQMEAEQ